MCGANGTLTQNEYLLSLEPRDPHSFPFTDIPPPINDSAKCSLSIMRSGMYLDFPELLFRYGAPEGSTIPCPAYSFLIEKEGADGKTTRVLFDMGFRDTSERIGEIYKIMAAHFNHSGTPGVPQILETNGIPLDSISSFILSHAHDDHAGNLAKLPSTVSLVLGPGADVGEALAAKIDVPLEVVTGREIRQLSREKDKWEAVGTFKGLDFFGDGSFWILDAPGHMPGHISGLVRTSVNPPAYYVLGGDTAHLIDLLNTPKTPHTKTGVFPLKALKILHPEMPDEEAERTMTSMHQDLAEAYATMAKMGRLDMEPNVNVILPHDVTMELVLGKGDFVRLDGTLDELKRLKNRDRSIVRL